MRVRRPGRKPFMDCEPRVAGSYAPAGLTARTFANDKGGRRLQGYEFGRFWLVPDSDTEGRRLWTVCNADTGRVVSWNYSMNHALAVAGWLGTPRFAGMDS